jgi:MinD superfamily P-loop ATPase
VKIAILSGKGGTGKSSATSSIALAISKKRKIVLVDADADCPNQHILFPGKKLKEKEISVSKIAVIDYRKCSRCGACTVVCPNKAIRLIPKKSGSITAIKTRHFPLVYGRLLPGSSGTGKVVYEIKKLAEEIGKKEKANIILIDSSPGIGCPVIASITGCDHVVGIVEPTPTSITALERALKVVAHFNIPFSIAVNKAGISRKNEQRIEKKFGKNIIARIPYDDEIPRLLAKGIPPLLGKGRGASGFKELAEAVWDIINR